MIYVTHFQGKDTTILHIPMPWYVAALSELKIVPPQNPINLKWKKLKDVKVLIDYAQNNKDNKQMNMGNARTKYTFFITLSKISASYKATY